MDSFNMDRSIHEDFEMVDSSALPFDLQAPPSSLFLQSTEHSAIHDDRPLTVPTSSISGKRHQYSSAQWEELKPLIRRLYLDENRTFTDVATTLRDTHGFFPTKRQFSRRVNTWGFEKNIKLDKRRSILQSLESGADQELLHNTGLHISEAKLGRWRKEIKLRNLPEPPSSSITTIVQGSPIADAGASNIGDHRDVAASSSDSLHAFSDDVSLTPQSILKDSYSVNDHLSLDHWATVDVPGSPKLSRLFAALGVSSPGEVSSLSLPPPSVILAIPTSPRFLSTADLLNLYANETEDRTEEVKTEMMSGSSCALPTSSVNVEGRDRSVHITHLEGSTFSPFGIPMIASPFNEIYPFPTSPSATVRSSIPEKTYFSAYQIREVECNERLGKLMGLCSKIHPGIINTMNELAQACRFQGKLRAAEHWYKQVLIAIEEKTGAMTLDTLPFWLNLLDVLINQGRHQLARSMHRQIHSRILDLCKPESEMAMRSLLIMAATAGFMGEFEEELVFYRQLLQMRLNNLGPKHRDTVAAMARLAIPMRDLGKYVESENLLRAAMQLYHEVPGIPEDGTCRRMRNLAMLLGQQGRYDESKILFQMSAERSAVSLGQGHPGTLASYYGVGRVLRRQGHTLESEKIFQETLQKQLKVYGENHPSATNNMFELAETLMELNDYKRATIWYEKSLRGRLEVYGPDSKITLLSCESLGMCYNAQGRYADALALYQQTMAKVKSTKGGIDPAVAEIREWIEALQDGSEEEESHEDEMEEGGH